MARKDKPLQLRTVDDSAPEPAPAVRLENRETEWKSREPKPVRLGPTVEEAGVSKRLALPDRDEVELRTHQPGIDVLIEPEAAVPEELEENWGEAVIRRNPIPWGWFALIGLAITGSVLWSLSRVEQADEHADWIRTKTVTALVDDEQEELEATRLIERIDARIREFANATSVEALSRMVRQPERVTPLMRSHYKDKPVFPGQLRSIRTLQPVTLDNRGNFWMASVSLGDLGTKSMILEIGEDGEPRVDWETFVCHQPMEWDAFATARPTGTSLAFRVRLERDHFHSHEFADSNKWTCFRLTALDSVETLFGYVAAGGPEEAEILRVIESNGGGGVSLILRLGIPDGLRSRQGVVIEKVLSPRWIYLDPPASGA